MVDGSDRTPAAVLVFADRQDPHDGWGRAQLLAHILATSSVPVRLIDRLPSTAEDLLLIVKHRVVATPAVIVTNAAGLELARWRELPTAVEALRYLVLTP